MTVIRTENLGKTYGGGSATVALRGLNLQVGAGEVFGFLGPNGAGKTTTIHLLLNLIRPSSGAAFLFERPVVGVEVRRRLGYLPESVNLHDYYRGGKLLEFYAALAGVPRETRDARIAHLMKLLNLQEAATKPVTKYSKGMLQRLGLAQALLHDPDLLILDEPTSSLDPVGRKEFRDILLALKGQGKAIFISSHILSEVESVCDRVAILQKGELKRVGTMQELSAVKSTRLTLKNLPGPLIEALAATPAQLTMTQGQVVIKCPDEATRKVVEELLARHSLVPDRVETDTQSLEDIFFSTIETQPTT